MAESARPSSPRTRPLRVLLTADCVGGVFTYAMVLAKELASAGVEVHVATMGQAMRPEQREIAHAVPWLVLHESTYALEWMDDPWADVESAGRWLVALERDVKPDVVHLDGYAHGDAGFRAPVVVVGHSCVLSWWEAVLGESAPPSWDTYRERVRRGIAAAQAVVAPTAAMLATLEAHYGPLPNGTTVHNGLPPASSPAPTVREPFVLAAGRAWDPAKNLATLARVAPRLPWPVRIAGSDVHPDGTTRPLHGVTALGWLSPEALASEMEKASLYAHPARYEPFGLGPLEAAQRGCALVLGDIASLREVWGDAATFVAPDDEDGLARALTTLIEDDVLRARMSARARARARRYTAASLATGTLDAYARAGVTRARELLARRRDEGGDACAS